MQSRDPNGIRNTASTFINPKQNLRDDFSSTYTPARAARMAGRRPRNIYGHERRPARDGVLSGTADAGAVGGIHGTHTRGVLDRGIRPVCRRAARGRRAARIYGTAPRNVYGHEG